MDPRSKIYNTRLTIDEVLMLFEESFVCSMGNISDMFDWKSVVLDDFKSRPDGILIGEAVGIVNEYWSPKLVRNSNTPITNFREKVREFYKNKCSKPQLSPYVSIVEYDG